MTAITANSLISAAKARPLFYTRAAAGVRVTIWKNARATHAGAPVMTGTIDGQNVAGFLRNGPKGTYVEFLGPKQKDGTWPIIAKGNLQSCSECVARLVVIRNGVQTWCETTREATEQTILSLGLKINNQRAKEAA